MALEKLGAYREKKIETAKQFVPFESGYGSPVSLVANKMLNVAGSEIARTMHMNQLDGTEFNFARATLYFYASILVIEDALIEKRVNLPLMRDIIRDASFSKSEAVVEKQSDFNAPSDFVPDNWRAAIAASERDHSFSTFFENEDLMPKQVLSVLKRSRLWGVIQESVLPQYKANYKEDINSAVALRRNSLQHSTPA